MEQKERIARVKELEKEIAALPVGSVSRKKINGKIYYYRRWTENGKRVEKYVSANEVEGLRQQIQKRKALESELKGLQQKLPKQPLFTAPEHDFLTSVRTGISLRTFSSSVKSCKKREYLPAENAPTNM